MLDVKLLYLAACVDSGFRFLFTAAKAGDTKG